MYSAPGIEASLSISSALRSQSFASAPTHSMQRTEAKRLSSAAIAIMSFRSFVFIGCRIKPIVAPCQIKSKSFLPCQRVRGAAT
jgi:hypothetical protein